MQKAFAISIQAEKLLDFLRVSDAILAKPVNQFALGHHFLINILGANPEGKAVLQFVATEKEYSHVSEIVLDGDGESCIHLDTVRTVSLAYDNIYAAMRNGAKEQLVHIEIDSLNPDPNAYSPAKASFKNKVVMTEATPGVGYIQLQNKVNEFKSVSKFSIKERILYTMIDSAIKCVNRSLTKSAKLQLMTFEFKLDSFRLIGADYSRLSINEHKLANPDAYYQLDPAGRLRVNADTPVTFGLTEGASKELMNQLDPAGEEDVTLNLHTNEVGIVEFLSMSKGNSTIYLSAVPSKINDISGINQEGEDYIFPAAEFLSTLNDETKFDKRVTIHTEGSDEEVRATGKVDVVIEAKQESRNNLMKAFMKARIGKALNHLNIRIDGQQCVECLQPLIKYQRLLVDKNIVEEPIEDFEVALNLVQFRNARLVVFTDLSTAQTDVKRHLVMTPFLTQTNG